MIDLLNQSLADVLDLHLQARQAHWNVKGPNFIGLHELFDKTAGELEEFSDELAERAVALGGIARGALQAVNQSTRLPAYPSNITAGREQLAALSDALATFGASARTAIDAAGSAGDADTADLFTQVSRGADKMLWLLEAQLQAES